MLCGSVLAQPAQNWTLVLYSERQFEEKFEMITSFTKFNMDCCLNSELLPKYCSHINSSKLGFSNCKIVGFRLSAMGRIEHEPQWVNDLMTVKGDTKEVLKADDLVEHRLLEAMYKASPHYRAAIHALRDTTHHKVRKAFRKDTDERNFREILGGIYQNCDNCLPYLDAAAFIKRINAEKNKEIYTWSDIVKMTEGNPLMWIGKRPPRVEKEEKEEKKKKGEKEAKEGPEKVKTDSKKEKDEKEKKKKEEKEIKEGPEKVKTTDQESKKEEAKKQEEEDSDVLFIAPLLLLHWALIRPSKRARISIGTKDALKAFLLNLPTTMVGMVP
eukprot:TRINITY_DN5982_c0_g1_i2.p1 TRINITY_DN5982_c0_g1~~TRINITY_DN5982_c0_g1_i2.p1  ORF type:complete len:328 (-),score=66.75 TRINITY_DN5982_c0_g1_i2:222-1205(-)